MASLAEERDAERAVFRYVPRQKLWATEDFATGVLSRLQDHVSAIQPEEKVILVVGGRESNSSQSPLSRWHSIDLRVSRVSAFTAPDRLYGAALGYDPAVPRILLFGGSKGDQGASDLLWQLDLQQSPTRPQATTIRPRGDRPPARSYHASVYDPARRWFLVYGGLGSNELPITENYTWVFDTTTATWAKLNGAWIGERYGATMVYDSQHQTPILIAGAVRGPRDLRGTLHYLDCTGLVPPPSSTAGETETATAVATPLGTETATAVVTATALASGTLPTSETPAPLETPTESGTATAVAATGTASVVSTGTPPLTAVATTTGVATPPEAAGSRVYLPMAVRP